MINFVSFSFLRECLNLLKWKLRDFIFLMISMRAWRASVHRWELIWISPSSSNCDQQQSPSSVHFIPEPPTLWLSSWASPVISSLIKTHRLHPWETQKVMRHMSDPPPFYVTLPFPPKPRGYLGSPYTTPHAPLLAEPTRLTTPNSLLYPVAYSYATLLATNFSHYPSSHLPSPDRYFSSLVISPSSPPSFPSPQSSQIHQKAAPPEAPVH